MRLLTLLIWTFVVVVLFWTFVGFLVFGITDAVIDSGGFQRIFNLLWCGKETCP